MAGRAAFKRGMRGPLALVAAMPLLAGCSLSGAVGRHSVAYNTSVEARRTRCW
jgi:hypothetical protein